MKKFTEDKLKELGYKLLNAKVEDVSLNMRDHGCLTLSITLSGGGWGVVYGGYCLGKGYLGADDKFFSGSAKGMESIIRIMDVVGVEALEDMKGKYVRIASKGLGSSVKIIGNIISDKWFDYESFFEDGDN